MAIEPPWHPFAQHDLPIAQRQEQIRVNVGLRRDRKERCARDAGAEVEQHRMDRLAADVLGQVVADGDVADRLPVADPQRLQR